MGKPELNKHITSNLIDEKFDFSNSMEQDWCVVENQFAIDNNKHFESIFQGAFGWAKPPQDRYTWRWW